MRLIEIYKFCINHLILALQIKILKSLTRTRASDSLKIYLSKDIKGS